MSTETANPVAAAIAVFEKNVKALAVELPGITFGYIGNVERWAMIARGKSSCPTLAAKSDALAECARKRYHNGSRRV